MAPAGYLEEQDSAIARSFGFRVKRVAGCDVTSALVDSVKLVNRQSDNTMKAKHGAGWAAAFEKSAGLKIALPFVGE